jgi:lysyl-tRNA synthetase class 2
MATLRQRATLLRQIRTFFDTREYTEVLVPVLTETPIPEAHLELFHTTFAHPMQGSRELYLLPSPEYYLKQLLAQGSGSIYAISQSFRNAESLGHQHNPEFTMLEYYTKDADSTTSLDITTELLRVLGERREALVISMAECWRQWTGIDLAATIPGGVPSPELLREGMLRQKITARQHDELSQYSWEDLFQMVFLNHIEPQLPRDTPVFITRYPAAVPVLAQTIPGTPWADRWELYLRGMEVANCFGEETDPVRILQFMQDQQHLKEQLHRPTPPWDTTFLQPPNTLPQCSGVALGIERLGMYFFDEKTINRVISFPLFR